MNINLYTIFIASALTNLLLSLLFLFYFVYQRDIRVGSGFWAFRYFLVGMTFTLILFRSYFPAAFNLLVPSILAMWAAIEQIRGIAKYQNIRMPARRIYLVLLLYVALLLIFSKGPILVRNSITSILSMILYAYSGILLLIPIKQQSSKISRIVGGIFIFTGFIHLMRMITNIFFAGSNTFFDPIMIQPYYSLAYLVIAIITGFGLLMLINQRLIDIRINLMDEKELLFREMNHRVKNNFQIISSILSLQAGLSEEPNIKSALKSAESRVKVMAGIHEKFSRFEEKGKISFETYARELIDCLVDSLKPPDSEISVAYNIQAAEFYTMTIMPLGMILNEIVTNSIKYAFSAQDHGRIEVSLFKRDDTYRLEIRDNGCGLRDALTLKEPDTLGTSIVHSFAKKIYGTVSFRNENGLVFTLDFKETNPIRSKKQVKELGFNTSAGRTP